MTKHRSLHVVATLESGGVASQLATLAAGLLGEGHAVRVVALRDGPLRGSLEASGATVDVLPRRHTIDPLVAWRLGQLVGEWRPSVVHAWDEASAAFAHAAGVGPLVVHAGEAATSSPNWLEKRVDHSVRRYLAASQPIADSLIAAGRVKERVVLAPRAVAPLPSEEKVTREQAFEELELPPQARAIAVVSRLEPRKNVRELIWCADLVRVLNDDVRLVIFGEGPVRGELERFAHMASDLEHVRFAGQREEVRSLLPHFELLWHAGDESAPPLAVLEAMAAGLPVVADDTPGARETVVDGETGFLVPVAGRAERARVTQQLFEDEPRRLRIGEAAQQRVVECFSVAASVDATVAAYEAVQPEAAAVA